MTKPEFVRIKVGNLMCESGIIILTDPQTINEHWNKIHPQDLPRDKQYIQLSSLKTLQYGKDFISEHNIVEDLGKSIAKARTDGDINECVPKENRSYDLRGAQSTSGRINERERDWTLKNPESGLPGAAIIAVPETGEGLYPVYAVMKYDPDNDKYHCIELKIDLL